MKTRYPGICMDVLCVVAVGATNLALGVVPSLPAWLVFPLSVAIGWLGGALVSTAIAAFVAVVVWGSATPEKGR
jgi:hypothetical protein